MAGGMERTQMAKITDRIKITPPTSGKILKQ